MKHPIHILTTGSPATPHQVRELDRNCSSQGEGPGPEEVTYTFAAQAVNDHDDRTIVLNRTTRDFRVLPRPGCACAHVRDPLHCECIQEICPICQEPLAAMTVGCTDQGCVNDDCPLCHHYRETCGYAEILQAIAQEAAEALRNSPNDPQSQAYVSAIAQVLAPGVGDAPIFPVTTRVLNELLNHGEPNPTGAWTCPDGSTVQEDPNIRGWLEYMHP